MGTWEINKISATIGCYYNLYVILDLYGWCVVGWSLTRSEADARAAMFVRETILSNSLDLDDFSIQADRGAVMMSRHLSQCCLRNEHHAKVFTATNKQRQYVLRITIYNFEVRVCIA